MVLSYFVEMDITIFWISLFSAILISLANLSVKANVKDNPLITALLFRSLSMIPLTSIFWISKGVGTWLTGDSIAYIFICSIFGFTGVFYFFKASQVSNTPSLIAGLSSCNGLMVTLFGVYFGFPISLQSLPGILLVTLGLLITSIDLSDIKNSSLFEVRSGIPYMMVVLVFWGVAYNMLGIISAKIDPSLAFFIINIFEIGFCVALFVVTKTSIAAPSSGSILPILTYGFFLVLGFSGQMYSMSKATPGLVSSVVSSSAVFSLVMASVFMNEKLNLQKYFGMSIVFCGLVIINLMK
jgi:drug/metabolite transporter (DMT)-like permease